MRAVAKLSGVEVSSLDDALSGRGPRRAPASRCRQAVADRGQPHDPGVQGADHAHQVRYAFRS